MILTRWRKTLLGMAIVAAVLGLGLFALAKLDVLSGVSPPRPPKVEEGNFVRLAEKQGWKTSQADWYHHASQGTRILPLDWFMNLEQPALLWPAGKLSDSDYLERFGFLPSKKLSELNPGTLPIGFAIEENFDAPYAVPPSNGKEKVVGLTCAACHTGLISYQQGSTIKSVLIEGGSAMINLAAFQEAVGRSLDLTLRSSSRFERFARAVLKDKADQKGKDELRDSLQQYLVVGMNNREYARVHKLNGTEGGFGRTDALGLIGNRVFGTTKVDNQVVPDAPVNIPHIWTAPWFDWVQYNGSIRMPLVRNIGEALGVGAPVKLESLNPKDKSPLYQSTINLKNLAALEDQLGGETASCGLQAPKWADTGLKPIDEPQRVRGAGLYHQYCKSCHLRPIKEILKDYAAEEWCSDSGKSILKLKKSDLFVIGTDPNQAMNLYRRVAVLDGKTISAAKGLFVVTELARRRKLQDFEAANEDVSEINFNRDRSSGVCDLDENELLSTDLINQVILPNLYYKARPLNGIWATPPYLHNGSVPNLYQLLVPWDRRDKVFYTGSTMFDEKYVGYEKDATSGSFRFDTSLPGNGNGGHEFRNLSMQELELSQKRQGEVAKYDPQEREAKALEVSVDEFRTFTPQKIRESYRKATEKVLGTSEAPKAHPFKGIIGPEFTDDERWALVEYLKSL
ncbi:di-heme-cytochrome C peroxidase [Singulisphaera sp. PoT]|uniref:di-heme-cytochrome C peroxidase n=1 Tax=Singulisphaera sp. PoT TaxID=3411797 RepID=UPI003BF50F5E